MKMTKSWFRKKIQRIGGRRISTIYLMKDMISHRALAHPVLRKRRKTIITIFRFIGGKKMLK